jgi:hypothetical protein
MGFGDGIRNRKPILIHRFWTHGLGGEISQSIGRSKQEPEIAPSISA